MPQQTSVPTDITDFRRPGSLLAPARLGPLALRNRIYMPAMGTSFGDEHGRPTGLQVDYYRRRAEGGVGLIITEIHAVEARGRSNARQLKLWDADHVAGIRPLVAAIHAGGARVIAQLGHAGRQTIRAAAGTTPVAPSAGVVCEKFPHSPRALETGEIDGIVRAYARTARLAVEAGYDGVEIHGAHGFLISQFLSRFANHRTDAYGGTLSRRVRFAEEVVRAVRAAIGPSRLLVIRLSAYEGVPNGLTLEESCRIAATLGDAGVDAIDVSAGMAANRHLYCAPAAVPRGHLVDCAKAIKASTRAAVLVPGRIVEAGEAEAVLAAGSADFIGMARAILVDPDMPKKVAAGHPVRPCIGCHQGCRSQPISCMINPELGMDEANWAQPAAKSRNVAIVGAGPAGLECARIAARRGHRVTHFEKSQAVGGQLLWGSYPPAKGEITAYLDYQRGELLRLGVDLRLGEKADLAAIEALRPDHLVLATGSKPRPETLPGAELALSPEAALHTDRRPGKIVIVGAGETGAEIADLFAARGANVVLVAASDSFGEGMQDAPHLYLAQRLREANVDIRPNCRIDAITPDGVIGHHGEMRFEIAADAVVLATGIVPDRGPRDLVADGPWRVHRIGDAAEIGDAKAAILAGYRLGCAL